jgi:hypothetical protein
MSSPTFKAAFSAIGSIFSSAVNTFSPSGNGENVFKAEEKIIEPIALKAAHADPPLVNARQKRVLAIADIVRECAQKEPTISRDALILRVMEEVANKYPSERLNTGQIESAWTIGILLTNCPIYFI